MSAFICGGSTSGKSMFAQKLARAYGGPLYYVATMIPHDGEDAARIRHHRDARAGWGFVTIERGRDILGALDGVDPAGAFLVDSVTALLANEMFAPSGICEGAPQKVADELCAFARRAPKAVFVSDDIFCDAARYDAWTEAFRAGLGMIHRASAACCDVVLEVASGRIVVHKGSLSAFPDEYPTL